MTRARIVNGRVYLPREGETRAQTTARACLDRVAPPTPKESK